MSAATHIIVEAKDDRDDGMAREIAGDLAEAYPGHPWHVFIGGGMLVIKHGLMSAKWGVARKYSRIAWGATVRKKTVVFAAGELLERAGMARGPMIEGQYKRQVEGIPTKDLQLA